MQSLWLRASLGAPVVGTEPACVRRTPSREKTLATGAVVKSLRGRRDVLLAGSALAGPFLTCGPSQGASEAVNSAWGAITGTQPDLYFPSSFAGDWEVTATLKSVETPMGGDFVQDERVVESARQGIGRGVRYTQRFTRNSAGRVVPDRAFNTVRLVEAMSGPGAVELSDWDVEEPNVLRLTLKGGRGTRPLKSLTVR